ncbi:hypothetical protein C0989_002141 [Termitomyces sp. Mn162]|nr:hypothetical protein C0989_002141 [Termitomyces sp. Mn162]
MSTSSGIGIAPQLVSVFASAPNPRFIKVSIHNEQLVHDLTISAAAPSFEQDLPLLPDVLQDNVPAYILAKVSPSDWLAISYVPESAKVRDKMLYASTRASLLKALGSTLFTDSLFATSKADLTPEAYAVHRRHINAPKPLSAREQEIADVRAAESGGVYEGSRARVNHIGTGVGFQWSEDLQDAVRHLAQGEQSAIVIIAVKTLLVEAPSTTRLASRKIETSDPSELDEAYLKSELGFDVIGPVDGQSAGTGFRDAEEKKPFARPRGPARKR